jgi:glyoxylase-like metal-dependent hydrolase (beta-lactamase superfamily II)
MPLVPSRPMSTETRRWIVGRATITALVEAQTAGIPVQSFFPTATADDVRRVDWLDPGTARPDGTIAFRVQAFVVQMGGRTVLVDPCVGNGKQRSLPFWNDLHLPWLDRFHEAGFATTDIDTVVHTHLHEDHLGWDTHLVEGEWAPTFATARHVYVDDELSFAEDDHRRRGQDPFADSIEPVVRAGLADVVAADADLGDGFRLVSTPGHTPGHVSLRVDSGGDGLMISGDLLHHQFQLADPSIAEVADWDVGMAQSTRAAFFDDCATRGAMVAGTHFAVEPVGRIERHANAWRFRSIAGMPVSAST